MAERDLESPVDQTAWALSRSLYRRLADSLPERADPDARQRILDACEITMLRLIGEPDFARPASFLFEEIRGHFSLGEQLWVRRLVERHLALAREALERLPPPKRGCGAFTRAGEPCQREPVADSEFCPSHRHLELMGTQT